MVIFALILSLLSGGADMGKMQRAQALYERLWARADGLYGAEGATSPYVNWGGPQANTVINPDGSRSITVPDYYVKLLGSRTKMKGHRKLKRANRRGVRQAKDSIAHEWTHLYQDPNVIGYYDTPEARATAEAGANAFSDALRRRLKRGDAIDQALYAQFGANYGADPRAIRWGQPPTAP